jgi:CDP-diglyceride synthetase
MIAIAIEVLWLLIGAICLAFVIWLVLYGIKNFITPIPDRIEKGIWFIVLILILIGGLTLLAGGSLRSPFAR